MQDSGLQDSIGTLQKENDILLQRLQKAENALQKARDRDDSDEEVKVDKAKPADAMSQEGQMKLAQLEQQLASIKRAIHAAKEECIKDIMRSITAKINEVRQAFIDKELLEKKIRDDKVVGWNNIVKECKQV